MPALTGLPRRHCCAMRATNSKACFRDAFPEPRRFARSAADRSRINSIKRKRGAKRAAPFFLKLTALSHHKRIAGLDPGIYPDALHLQVFVDRTLAILASYAAIFIATEWRHETHSPISVDPYRAGLDALRHADRSTHIASPHTRAEPKAHIVGNAHCVFLILERNDRQNRPEYFFLRDAHFIVHACENG